MTEAPKVPQKLMYKQEPDQITQLAVAARCVGDQALISLLADSRARSSEPARIQVDNLDMDGYRIQVWGKEKKQAWLIFGWYPAAGGQVYPGTLRRGFAT